MDLETRNAKEHPFHIKPAGSFKYQLGRMGTRHTTLLSNSKPQKDHVLNNFQ